MSLNLPYFVISHLSVYHFWYTERGGEEVEFPEFTLLQTKELLQIVWNFRKILSVKTSKPYDIWLICRTIIYTFIKKGKDTIYELYSTCPLGLCCCAVVRMLLQWRDYLHRLMKRKMVWSWWEFCWTLWRNMAWIRC